MPSLWQYSRNLIKVSIGAGIVFSSVGMLLLTLMKEPGPGPVMLAFGCCELVFGITGHLFSHRSILEKSFWPMLTGTLLLASGLSLCIFSVTVPSESTVFGFAGVYLCIVSLSVVLTSFVATRPVNANGLKAAGIGLGIAGLPVFYLYGLVPGMNSYMFLSVLPLVLGFELAIYASVLKSFRSIERVANSISKA